MKTDRFVLHFERAIVLVKWTELVATAAETVDADRLELHPHLQAFLGCNFNT